MTVAKDRLGLLFVLVGPGGVGKNTLMKGVLSRISSLKQLPTATTRPARENEQHGREHMFLSHGEFQQLIDDQALIEYQEVSPGHFYGVPRQTVEDAISEQRDLIADIEIYGAEILRHEFTQSTVLVYVVPPSLDQLIDQMRNRGSTEDLIASRMRRAEIELKFAPLCDYVIVNDDLERAGEEMYEIVRSEQAGEATRGRQPRIVVSYRAHILPMSGDKVLAYENGQPGLYAPVPEGTHPDALALRVLENMFDIEGDAALLSYGSDNPLAPDPIGIDYRPDRPTYELTYYYSYPIPPETELPEGYHWLEREAIALAGDSGALT